MRRIEELTGRSLSDPHAVADLGAALLAAGRGTAAGTASAR
ncbi:hypothetical protein [Streptomyces sp. NPDC057403]